MSHTLDIDVNVRFESIGPVYYNGHIIIYGFCGEAEIKCASCDKSIKPENIFIDIPREREPMFWLAQFAEFRDKCSGNHDTFDEVVKERMAFHIGQIDRPTTIRKSIEELYIGPIDVYG